MELSVRMAAAGLALGMMACGGGEWTGTVSDSAGVRMVRNGNEGAWSPETRWTVETDVRIGSAEGEPEYQFGQIAGIAIGPEGRIFVLDQAGPHIKVFRPDRWERSPVREIVHQLRPLIIPGQAPAAAPDSMDVIVVRRSDGTLGDTLLRVPSGQSFSFQSGRPEFNLFSAEPIWALGADRTVFMGVNDDYRIGRYAEGALEQVITMPFEQSPVTPDDQEMIVNAISRLWEEAGVPPQAIPQLRAGIHFADFYPAYVQFLAGPKGTLWVQHVQVPGEMSTEERETYNPLANLGSDDWDVFDPDGRFLGSVTMPLRFQPMRFVDEMIYGVQRDELDIQYVVRVRIDAPAS